MKKIFKVIVASAFLLCFGNAQNNLDLSSLTKELTGDTKLACEAILCLSAATRPGECAASIAKYFSINAKEWAETIAKRKAFLKLCPVGDGGNDNTFVNLRDNVLVNLRSDCSPESLNSRIQVDIFNFDGGTRKVRINPTLPSGCASLINHNYTDTKLKYTCSDKFYTSYEWDRGYTTDNKPINKNCRVKE